MSITKEQLLEEEIKLDEQQDAQKKEIAKLKKLLKTSREPAKKAGFSDEMIDAAESHLKDEIAELEESLEFGSGIPKDAVSEPITFNLYNYREKLEKEINEIVDGVEDIISDEKAPSDTDVIKAITQARRIKMLADKLHKYLKSLNERMV